MCSSDYMATARARCPDCRQVVEVPYDWCAREFRAPDLVADMLVEHARLMPLLHPTLLPDQHLTIGRPG